MQKHQDIQPLLDYFNMLERYEQKGFLEVLPEKGEAYITRAALFSLCYGDDAGQLADTSDVAVSRRMEAVADVIRNIRAYAGWKSQKGATFMESTFALHTVEDEHPHDLCNTFLVTRQRRWFSLWRKIDRIEVINYGRYDVMTK